MFKRKPELELTVNLEGAFTFHAKGREHIVRETFADLIAHLEEEVEEAKPQAAPFKVGFNKVDVEELESETKLEPAAAELEDDDDED